MFQKITLTTAIALMALTQSATAQSSQDCATAQECTTAQECPTAKKVNGLLERWEAVTEQASTTTVAQRERFTQRVASAAKSCPVGSRMNSALSAVDDVLRFVNASTAANAEHCPLEECGDEYPEAKQMKQARLHALASLNQLASYASSMTCTDASSTQTDCDTKANCPIALASRIGALKASFAMARREAESLSSEARGQVLASFGTLAKENAAITLVPETVVTLVEGFEALNQLHKHMGQWAQAHPELMSKVPASAHQAFMMEAALLNEAHGLLHQVTVAMHAMQAPESQMQQVSGR